jgi:hypothetical protein
MSDHFCTPPELLKPVYEFFGGGIDLDPCSNQYATVEAKTKMVDSGLDIEWEGNVYCNPPYSEKALWSRKATESYTKHLFTTQVLLLIPCNPSTKWWQEYLSVKSSVGAEAICFLNKRVRFWLDGKPAKHTARFDCNIAYYGRERENFETTFEKYGAIWIND